MAAHRKNYDKAADLYNSGQSISQVAAVYKVSRQSMHYILRRRGVQFRQTQLLISITFEGVKFSPGNYGYWRRTDGDRELMHRYVWRFYNGPIPDGHDIHHKNHNRADNRIENLECKTKADHSRDHHIQPVIARNCLWCRGEIPRREHEGPSAYHRRNFCNLACSGHWLQGKPKGTKARCDI